MLHIESTILKSYRCFGKQFSGRSVDTNLCFPADYNASAVWRIERCGIVDDDHL